MIIAFHARWWSDPPNVVAKHFAYEGFFDTMKVVTAAHPDIMFYTVHADSHYWITFSPGYARNWVNVMVEGSTRALTSYAKFSVRKKEVFDPIVVEEVHYQCAE